MRSATTACLYGISKIQTVTFKLESQLGKVTSSHFPCKMIANLERTKDLKRCQNYITKQGPITKPTYTIEATANMNKLHDHSLECTTPKAYILLANWVSSFAVIIMQIMFDSFFNIKEGATNKGEHKFCFDTRVIVVELFFLVYIALYSIMNLLSYFLKYLSQSICKKTQWQSTHGATTCDF